MLFVRLLSQLTAHRKTKGAQTSTTTFCIFFNTNLKRGPPYVLTILDRNFEHSSFPVLALAEELEQLGIG